MKKILKKKNHLGNYLKPNEINIKEEINKIEKLEHKKQLDELDRLDKHLMGLHSFRHHHEHYQGPGSILGNLNERIDEFKGKRIKSKKSKKEEEESSSSSSDDEEENEKKRKEVKKDEIIISSSLNNQAREIKIGGSSITNNPYIKELSNKEIKEKNNKLKESFERKLKKRRKKHKKKRGYVSLCGKKYFTLTFHSCLILFICSFIYYGMTFILPQNLDKIIKDNKLKNQTTDDTELNRLLAFGNINNYEITNSTSSNIQEKNQSDESITTQNSTDSNTDEEDSDFEIHLISHDLDDKVFDDLILSAFAEIPSTFFSIWIANLSFFGRKYSMVLCFLCTAVLALISIAWMSQLGMVAAILKFWITNCFSIIYIYVSEAYPTKVRGIGIALTNSFTRLAGIITPVVMQLLFDAKSWLPYLSFIITGCIAAVSCYLLPFETLGRELKDY